MRASKIYISGPMTGYAEYNFPAFDRAEAYLQSIGYDVMNPAKNEPQESWEEYMRKDIKMVCDCDVIYMLFGWQKSRGAILENFIACNLGLRILMENDHFDDYCK